MKLALLIFLIFPLCSAVAPAIASAIGPMVNSTVSPAVNPTVSPVINNETMDGIPPSLSQKATHSSQAHAIAEEELSKRLQFYRSLSILTVDFKQLKILNDLHVKLKAEGRLKLIRPDQVIWEIIKPSKVLVKFNQKEVQIESGEGAEYSIQTWKISDMPKDRDAKSIGGLVAWLQLDAHALSQHYSILSLGPRKFKFTPKEQEESPFRSLEMTLASTGHLETLVIHETSGDEIDLQFGVPWLDNQKVGTTF